MDRPLLVTSLVLSALMLLFVWELIGEAPPDRLTIAAGPRDGGYYAFAQRLARRIRQHGIKVTILETDGARDNLKAMAKPGGPQLALVQGGTRPPQGHDTAHLRTLATIDLEPVWILSKTSAPAIVSIEQFSERRLIGGRDGSGTRDLLDLILTRINVRPAAPILDLSNSDAARAFLKNDGDVVFSVVRWQSYGWVAALLQTGAVRFVELKEAPAITRNFRFLTQIEIPQGALDLARGIPGKSVKLLATATNLVVNSGVHSSTKSLVLRELQGLENGTAVLGTHGQFPSLAYADLPPDADAIRHFKHGPTFLRRYLPFWIATAVERYYALLLPLLTFLFPLSRLIPRWLQQRRHRHFEALYRRLQDIDLAIAQSATGKPADMRLQLSRLGRFDRELSRAHRQKMAPSQFMQFRQDIDRIRRRAEAAAATKIPPSDQGHREEANVAAVQSPDTLLARMQADLDILTSLQNRAGGTPLPKEFTREVEALRERLAQARRSLLHLSPAAQPPAPVEAAQDGQVNAPVATAIEKIHLKRGPSRTPADTSSE